MATSDPKKALDQLTDTLELYLVKKAPFTLPTGVKEFIVNVGPWITLVLMILALPLILALLGLGAILTPFSFLGGVQAGFGYIVGLVFSIIVLVLEAMALPGLFKKKKAGWNMMYYAMLLTAVEKLVRFDLAGLIIGTTISLYFLFQVREYYK